MVTGKSSLSTENRRHLLFIDDSSSQLHLYKQQMEAEYQVSLARTYEEAIAVLSTRLPDMIVLDMVMPEVSGLEFLDILRFSANFRNVPVVMVSGENDAKLVKEAFLKGAADYIRKPYDAEELRIRIYRLFKLAQNQQGGEAKKMVSAQTLMIQSLADLAATRDNETGQHLVRIEKYVGALTLAAAKHPQFQDFVDTDYIESMATLSILHDIGKVGIPDSILEKPGKLTPEEFEIMKTHTTKGAETIVKIQQSFPQYAFLEFARLIILYHHERWDGKGYPEGLAGEAIPFSARIVAICDVFDALTMKRVYKPAMSLDEALQLMTSQRALHFDPELLDLFLANLDAIKDIHHRYADADPV